MQGSGPPPTRGFVGRVVGGAVHHRAHDGPAAAGAAGSTQSGPRHGVRQLALGLAQYIDAKEMLPASGEWTVALLPYIEQRPLADAMKNHADAGGKYPRPALMKCPMQNDFESRLPTIGYCHYALVADRLPNGLAEPSWEIQDRPWLAEASEPPWYVGPEIRYSEQEELFSSVVGPHQAGQYMTSNGPRPQ